ncbi:MAG: hypothetical protein M3M88_06540 [Thermoproteota archaeon]|nr:hypothetical protein [Thermoproteota archaeon]
MDQIAVGFVVLLLWRLVNAVWQNTYEQIGSKTVDKAVRHVETGPVISDHCMQCSPFVLFCSVYRQVLFRMCSVGFAVSDKFY